MPGVNGYVVSMRSLFLGGDGSKNSALCMNQK